MIDQSEKLAAGEFVLVVNNLSGDHAFGDLFHPGGKPLMGDDWISAAQGAAHRSKWPRRHLSEGDRLAVYIHRANDDGDFFFVVCARLLESARELA